MFNLSDMKNNNSKIKFDIRGIEKSTYNIIFGEPNIGKSNFIYQLAFSLANNISFLNLNDRQKNPLKVVVLSSEDSENKIKNKIIYLQKLYNVDKRFEFGVLDSSKYIVSSDVVNAEKNLKSFYESLKDTKLDVLFIDTLESLLDINYYDKYAGLNKINILLDGICKNLGCTIFAAHHTKSDGTIEGAGLVKKVPRTILKIYKAKEQNNKYFYTGLSFEKINTEVIDSIEPLKKDNKYCIEFDVNLKDFTIENNLEPIANVSVEKKRYFYNGINNLVKYDENKFNKILYDRKFLQLGMFKNLKDGEELEKGVTYKYSDEKSNNIEVNMFLQLTSFDAFLYSTLLSMCADYESGTIIDHETAQIVHGENYQAKVTIDKDDQSGRINSINVVTTLKEICKTLNCLASSENCEKIMNSLKRMNLTVFQITNTFEDKRIVTSGKFLNISITEFENKPLTKYIVSVTLNPINAQVLLPDTYKHNSLLNDISYCMGYTEAEKKLGTEACNVYMFLINMLSANQVKEFNSKTIISKIYNISDIDKLNQKDLYPKRVQLDNLIKKINTIIPDHFEIKRKTPHSLVSYNVYRKK